MNRVLIIWGAVTGLGVAAGLRWARTAPLADEDATPVTEADLARRDEARPA